MSHVITFLCWAILWYLIIISFGYALLLLASIPDIIKKFKEGEIGNIVSLLNSHILPPTTLAIVAYNEAEHLLIDAIESALKSSYPNTEVIVVNNGSTDNTLQKLHEFFALKRSATPVHIKVPTRGKINNIYVSKRYNNLTVIDKTDKDKSDGLNAALNVCKTPLFITFDADTILEPDSVSHILYTMLTHPHTVAVGGSVYVLNGCRFSEGVMIEPRMSYKPLYALQTCEYLRSFMFGRAGWNTFGGSLSYSGAFTLFETQALINNEGFEVDNFANDLEVILHLQATKYEKKYPYQINYTPGASAWTEAPGTLKSYWTQRVKWQYGSLLSFFQYKRMFFNPRYKLVGLYVYPFFLMAEIFGHVIELLAYTTVFLTWYFGILDIYWAALLFLICFGFVMFLTVATTCLSALTFNKYRRFNDIFIIILYSFVEQFGFRQFHVLSRFWGTLTYLKDALLGRTKRTRIQHEKQV